MQGSLSKELYPLSFSAYSKEQQVHCGIDTPG